MPNKDDMFSTTRTNSLDRVELVILALLERRRM